MDERSRSRIQASRERSLAAIRRSAATVRRVIATNERLAEHPDHRSSAEQRIDEGHEELETLAGEEAEIEEKLRSGDPRP
jgi:hypothetical protein